jgi:hypothetical protein
VALLDELTPGARVEGLVVGSPVTIVAAERAGDAALTLTYRTDDGKTGGASPRDLAGRPGAPLLGLAGARVVPESDRLQPGLTG